MPQFSAQPVKFKVPPKYKNVIKELDFLCPSCTSGGSGEKVYHKLNKSKPQPISGPGDTYTRMAVICPVCSCLGGDDAFIQNGILNLEMVPVNYKAPKRPQISESVMTFDEDEAEAAQPVIRQNINGPQKKESDLHPKTRGRKPKGAVKAALAHAA